MDVKIRKWRLEDAADLAAALSDRQVLDMNLYSLLKRDYLR